MLRGGPWVISLFVVAGLAGCMGGSDSDVGLVDAVLPGILDVAADTVMGFTQSIVSPAQGLAADLYEPTMEVSASGTIYVAGHVVAAATTGTPAYYSNDDGATWQPLPFAGPLQSPPPVQGSQPPPGDEGFIVAGDDGQAWMADIYAAGFSVSGWCGDGAELCYDNRQAYDRTATLTAPCDAVVSLNDRPWAAYANGSLLLVNNPGGGPMQIGAMQVPALPVGSFDPVTGPVWNMCASPGGWIPGIPAMRDDGFFAVPQLAGGGADQRLTVTTGHISDIFDVENRDVFHVSSSYGGTINGGRTAFDAEGTLYVGAYNNTDYDRGAGETVVDDVEGRFIVAASTDDGKTYTNMTFRTGSAVRSLYMDSNPYGAGALVTWSQLGEEEGRSDWYVAHLFVGDQGEPVLQNVALAVDEGPHSSAHVMGASIGPDGRAYFVNFQGSGRLTTVGPVGVPDAPGYLLSTPISVWIQQDGPTLPAS